SGGVDGEHGASDYGAAGQPDGVQRLPGDVRGHGDGYFADVSVAIEHRWRDHVQRHYRGHFFELYDGGHSDCGFWQAIPGGDQRGVPSGGDFRSGDLDGQQPGDHYQPTHQPDTLRRVAGDFCRDGEQCDCLPVAQRWGDYFRGDEQQLLDCLGRDGG